MLAFANKLPPASWKAVFETDEVPAPTTMLVDEPNAPTYKRDDVFDVRNEKAAVARVAPPMWRSDVDVTV